MSSTHPRNRELYSERELRTPLSKEKPPQVESGTCKLEKETWKSLDTPTADVPDAVGLCECGLLIPGLIGLLDILIFFVLSALGDISAGRKPVNEVRLSGVRLRPAKRADCFARVEKGPVFVPRREFNLAELDLAFCLATSARKLFAL